MPARRTATTARPAAPAKSAPVPGAAMLLPDGGETVYVAPSGRFAVVKVGTGPRSLIRVPLEGLEAVDEAVETERHAKFRADAVRRGEIGG